MISFIATLILTFIYVDRHGRFLQPLMIELALLILAGLVCARLCGLNYVCVVVGSIGFVGMCICVYLLQFKEGFYFFER